jgi:hypothetical protein
MSNRTRQTSQKGCNKEDKPGIDEEEDKEDRPGKTWKKGIRKTGPK